MDCIELFPSLTHCIETTAREEYWDCVNKYMGRGQEDKELEQRIELLKSFLESADFKKFRRESESHLVAGKTVKFIICWKEGKPNYQMVVA
jgi:N-glycosylase/DNA lyase